MNNGLYYVMVRDTKRHPDTTVLTRFGKPSVDESRTNRQFRKAAKRFGYAEKHCYNKGMKAYLKDSGGNLEGKEFKDNRLETIYG